MHRTATRILTVGIGMTALVVLLALAFSVRGGGGDPGRALAEADPTPPSPYNASGITCTDGYLIELEAPQPWGTKHTAGDPVPTTGGGVYIALSKSIHDAHPAPTPNGMVGVSQAHNLLIPGVIPGTILDWTADLRCAAVSKNVATVTKDNYPTLQFDPAPTPPKGDHGPLPGMLVYYTDTGANRGFHMVTAVTANTVTLVATGATCNNVAAATEDDKLYACAPVNKGISPVLQSETNVTQSQNLAYTGKPRAQTSQFQQSDYDQATNTSTSIYCVGSQGPQEGATQNAWTRYEIRTVGNKDKSDQSPSLGTTQLFNPTEKKTCANNANTRRSTNVHVSWSLDSARVEGAESNWDSDYDKDKCLDKNELNAPQPLYQTEGDDNWTGGRDAFNPYDCDRNLTGIWGITATVTEVEWDGSEVQPGGYYRCRAYMQHDKGNNSLTIPAYCYIDIPGVAVNDEAGPTSGDGLGGSPYPIGSGDPPRTDGPYGQVDPTHTVLTGTYDKVDDQIELKGCFENVESPILGPNVYVETVATAHIDALTGNGNINIYIQQETTDCTGDDPQGTPVVATIQIVQHAGKDPQTDSTSAIDNYDFDLDGCPDANELSADERAGGVRDPFNTWDYFNPTHDGRNRIDDVLAVIANYRVDNPPATNAYDRTGVAGSNDWNFGPPNGTIRIADVLAAIFSYRHDCGGGDKTLPFWGTPEP